MILILLGTKMVKNDLGVSERRREHSCQSLRHHIIFFLFGCVWVGVGGVCVGWVGGGSGRMRNTNHSNVFYTERRSFLHIEYV